MIPLATDVVSATRANIRLMTRDQLKQLEDDIWSAADNLRANSDLKASEYGTPVLGLIFLKFADIVDTGRILTGCTG